MKKALIIGPLRNEDPVLREANVLAASDVGRDLLATGRYSVIIPHTMTWLMLVDDEDLELKIQDAMLDLIGAVDLIVVLPGWEHSVCTIGEFNHALGLGKPLHYWSTERDFILYEAWKDRE